MKPKEHLKKYGLYYLIILYFIFRLWNLTLLPIFNDEAIYLNWGWRELHTGNLYYSLFDAKQPLLMWIFDIFEDIFSDPLFAGRVVSVFTGLAGMLGIFYLTKKLFNKNIAYLAASLSIVTPLLSFYDRQALMESAIGAVGVWEVYFAVAFLQKPTRKYAIFVGILAGLGEFVKSSSLLFFVAFVITTFIVRKWKGNLLHLGVAILAMICVDSLLFINPMFWSTLSSNSRYSFTITDLLHFPIIQWMTNFEGNLEILFFYFTPLVFIFLIWGTITLIRKRIYTTFLYLTFLPIIFETFLSRGTTQRYLVSFTPLLVIIAIVGLTSLQLNTWAKKGLLIVAFVLSISITLLQINNPVAYFEFFSSLTRYADKEEYLTTQVAGTGIPKVITFLQAQSNHQPIDVATAINSGNPEDAVQVYLEKDPNVQFLYLDQSLFGNQLTGISCLQTDRPLYFISRDEQQGGLNVYFQKVTSIHNPYGTNSIGIYTLKQNCKGKTLRLNVGNGG